MAERNRRLGCGCLPLIVLFFVASTLLRVADESVAPEGILDLLVPGLVVVGALLVIRAAWRRRQSTERQDRLDDGMPSSRESEPNVDRPAPSSPPPRQSRPPAAPSVEDLATQNLRRELKGAVEDLKADRRGEPFRPITSEEMIARAKRRLSDFGNDNPDSK